MARTRGAANIAADATEGADDVMIIGDAILTAPPPVAVVESILAPPAVYTCSPATLDRNLEASELAEILARVLGGWSVEIGTAEWSALRPDVRRHFKRTA
jgi:hypothetical protein